MHKYKEWHRNNITYLFINVSFISKEFTNNKLSHQIDYLEDFDFDGRSFKAESSIILGAYWNHPNIEIVGRANDPRKSHHVVEGDGDWQEGEHYMDYSGEVRYFPHTKVIDEYPHMYAIDSMKSLCKFLDVNINNTLIVKITHESIIPNL